jgi:hypothetical protein
VTQFGVMRMLTFSPSQAISDGATYFASLTPSELWSGPLGDGLDGYQSTYWVDPSRFYLWWQAQPVNSYGALNIHQAAGRFVNAGLPGDSVKGLTKRRGITTTR